MSIACAVVSQCVCELAAWLATTTSLMAVVNLYCASSRARTQCAMSARCAQCRFDSLSAFSLFTSTLSQLLPFRLHHSRRQSFALSSESETCVIIRDGGSA